MEHELKEKMRRTNGAVAEKWKTNLAIAGLVLLLVASVSCNNESSTENISENDTEDRVHADLPADPRRGATEGDPSEPWQAPSGIVPHEHVAKHGGVVRSVDVYHVELTENPMQVWLYDRRGEPFPVEGLEGQVVVYSDDQRHPHTLVLRGDYLTPVEPVDLPDEGSVFVELTLDKQSIDVAYELPLQATPPGA